MNPSSSRIDVIKSILAKRKEKKPSIGGATKKSSY